MDYFDWKNVVDGWYQEVDIFDEQNVYLRKNLNKAFPLFLFSGETFPIFYSNWSLFPASVGRYRQGDTLNLQKEI